MVGLALPPDWRMFDQADRQRCRDTHQLLIDWQAFRARFPKLPEETVIKLFRAERGAWAKERGLRITLATLARYRERLPLDGNVDGRGRQPKKHGPLDPRVRDAYLQIALHANFADLGEAWRHARDTAQEHHLPMQSPAWFRRWFAREYPKVFVRYSKSKRKFEAENLPKIHRNYDDVSPLEWVSLDGHEMNLFVRVPTANQSWKRVRPILDLLFQFDQFFHLLDKPALDVGLVKKLVDLGAFS